MTLQRKLHLMLFLAIIPFVIITGILIFLLIRSSNLYESAISNVTAATEFSHSFKSNVDEKMYKIVVGSETLESADPYEDIDSAETVTKKLAESASTEQSRSVVRMNEKLLTNLRKYVGQIGKDAGISGNYDKNIQSLEDNIYIITKLVTENVSNYIYDEAISLENSSEKLHTQVFIMIFATIGVLAAVVAILLFATLKVSNSIAKPISELASDVRKVGRGDFSIRATNIKGDEVKELSEDFNLMVERIDGLMKNIKTEQQNMRNAEFKLLQAQINPHFLYNTLDTIVWLAEDHEDSKVISMTNNLSEFFRTSLSKGRDVISIGEEKNHIESYLNIQKIRYEDILDFVIDIPEELQHYQIIKLSLQPLIENALYHGIKTKRGKGLIRVEGEFDNGKIILKVTDNGSGMTKEQLAGVRESVYNRKAAAEAADSGYGLYNVHERIRLTYGEEYGLSIDSEEGVGTTASIRIPALAPQPY